jgi:transcriptional regulator GlxA family with amidase domain
MRIERATTILVADPERPVGSVAFACGFDSESGFHRAFRAATGSFPGEYRRAGMSGQ